VAQASRSKRKNRYSSSIAVAGRVDEEEEGVGKAAWDRAI